MIIGDCSCGRRCRAGSDQCATCEAEDRKLSRNALKVKVVKPVKKVTAKRAGQLQEYAKLRKEYMALYPVCEVPECNERSVELHHQKGRENDMLLDTNYFFACCKRHHDEFTEHSKEAIENGYSVSRTAKQMNA